MKTINIFLGSSIDENKGLTNDRDKISSFVNGLNNRYVNLGYFIHLYHCEDMPASMNIGGSQKQHDDFIENSADASFFLFFKDAGKYTLGELALAHKTLKIKNKPAVFVFFKTGGTEPENTEAIRNAVDIVEKEYSHYYKVYNNIDTVKLEILQFFASQLPVGAIMAQDGKVYLNEEVVDELELNNIFAYQNSKEYKELSAEIAKLQEEIDVAVQKCDYKEIERLCNLKNEKTEDLHELEKNILEMLELLQKELGKQEIDKTRTAMLRLLEQGKYKDALAMCPMVDAEREAELFLKRKQLADEKFMQEAKSKIETAKLCILAHKMDYSDSNRFDKIDKRYEIACNYTSIAQDVEIILDYIQYLTSQKNFNKAVEIGEKLNNDFEFGKLSAEQTERARLFNLLANLYNSTQRFEEAEGLYIRVIEIFKGLAHEDAIYEIDLAIVYNNLANLYDEIRRFKEAEKLYKKAIEKLERLECKDIVYEANLAMNYNNLAILYTEIQQFKQAEKFYKQAIEIKERLARINPAVYQEDLAGSYNDFANLYSDTNRFEEAERFYKKAIEIQEISARENPSAYKPALLGSYTNLAKLYGATHRFNEAKELYTKAITAMERLAQENPAAYESDLARSYNGFADLYDNAEKFEEAEEFYKKAIELLEKSSRENSDANKPNLAVSYHNLATLLSRTQKYKEAAEFYKKAIEIYEILAQENPEIYEPYAANSYWNLATLFNSKQRGEDAFDYFVKAFDVAKKHPQNPICKQIIDFLFFLDD